MKAKQKQTLKKAEEWDHNLEDEKFGHNPTHTNTIEQWRYSNLLKQKLHF